MAESYCGRIVLHVCDTRAFFDILDVYDIHDVCDKQRTKSNNGGRYTKRGRYVWNHYEMLKEDCCKSDETWRNEIRCKKDCIAKLRFTNRGSSPNPPHTLTIICQRYAFNAGRGCTLRDRSVGMRFLGRSIWNQLSETPARRSGGLTKLGSVGRLVKRETKRTPQQRPKLTTSANFDKCFPMHIWWTCIADTATLMI